MQVSCPECGATLEGSAGANMVCPACMTPFVVPAEPRAVRAFDVQLPDGVVLHGSSRYAIREGIYARRISSAARVRHDGGKWELIGGYPEFAAVFNLLGDDLAPLAGTRKLAGWKVPAAQGPRIPARRANTTNPVSLGWSEHPEATGGASAARHIGARNGRRGNDVDDEPTERGQPRATEAHPATASHAAAASHPATASHAAAASHPATTLVPPANPGAAPPNVAAAKGAAGSGGPNAGATGAGAAAASGLAVSNGANAGSGSSGPASKAPASNGPKSGARVPVLHAPEPEPSRAPVFAIGLCVIAAIALAAAFLR
jgi:hypothetical protein